MVSHAYILCFWSLNHNMHVFETGNIKYMRVNLFTLLIFLENSGGRGQTPPPNIRHCYAYLTLQTGKERVQYILNV